MDQEEFKRCGRLMIDYVAQYCENIRDRPVAPSVQPGYLYKLIPDQAPEKPEDFEDIMKDVERVIMPGVSS
jgi:aromatic-L-amino-acid/L-tryptophan decarboxylase